MVKRHLRRIFARDLASSPLPVSAFDNFTLHHENQHPEEDQLIDWDRIIGSEA